MSKDPMFLASSDRERELFKLFAAHCNGVPFEIVMGAAANLIINSIRQGEGTWKGAEQKFDELFGKCKQILSSHYDFTGRKKGIFPYNQVIDVPKLDLDTIGRKKN